MYAPFQPTSHSDPVGPPSPKLSRLETSRALVRHGCPWSYDFLPPPTEKIRKKNRNRSGRPLSTFNHGMKYSKSPGQHLQGRGLSSAQQQYGCSSFTGDARWQSTPALGNVANGTEGVSPCALYLCVLAVCSVRYSLHNLSIETTSTIGRLDTNANAAACSPTFGTHASRTICTRAAR